MQDEHVHTQKVLALGSLCIPLGACITAIVCSTTLWKMDMDAADAQVHATAVAMQGKVRAVPSHAWCHSAAAGLSVRPICLLLFAVDIGIFAPVQQIHDYLSLDMCLGTCSLCTGTCEMLDPQQHCSHSCKDLLDLLNSRTNLQGLDPYNARHHRIQKRLSKDVIYSGYLFFLDACRIALSKHSFLRCPSSGVISCEVQALQPLWSCVVGHCTFWPRCSLLMLS